MASGNLCYTTKVSQRDLVMSGAQKEEGKLASHDTIKGQCLCLSFRALTQLHVARECVLLLMTTANLTWNVLSQCVP